MKEHRIQANKWTLGLAAVGLVTLPSWVQAEEKASSVMTALSSTTISGYVDTSAQWNLGTGNANAPGFSYHAGKQDGFNLNVVKLTIEKPLDEAQWSAGYRADLLFGPDANSYATASVLGGNTSDFAIKQAYVQLRAPVRNGLDFKIGVFDTIVGYESFDAVNNPNYTRSYGFTIEPTTHTGVLATYRFNDWLTASVGVANTIGPAINGRAFPNRAETYKTFMASAQLTAPKDWGWLADSALYLGVINGFNGATANTNGGANQTTYYAGATVKTPIDTLKTGVAFDYEAIHGDSSPFGSAYAWAAGLYASWQMCEKWSLHGRGEYEAHSVGDGIVAGVTSPNTHPNYGSTIPVKGIAATATLQYDLWKNVLSRVEFRWDHAADGRRSFGGSTTGAPSRKNAYMLAANIIYKF